MPTLTRLPSCRIVMCAADHLPPHFHVIFNDGREALVELATLTSLAGDITMRVLAPALQWAQEHSDVLQQKWKELNP